MAATDQPYRSRKTLDVVFAASCVLMLLCILWMFADDHNRQWKVEQRTFRDVEEALAQRQMLAMLDRLPDQEQMDQLNANVNELRAALRDAKKAVADKRNDSIRIRDLADSAYRQVKADRDSRASYKEIAVNERDAAKNDDARTAHEKEVQRLDAELKDLNAKLDKSRAALDEAERKLKELANEPVQDGKSVDQLEKQLSEAEDRLKRMVGELDRFGKTAAQKGWTFGDTFRKLPIIDAFASPTRINQIVLAELPIEYGSFKDVTRYDRCTTCHLGADRSPGYDREAIQALNDVPEGMQEKLDRVLKMFNDRRKADKEFGVDSLGFDPSDIRSKVQTVKLTKGQATQFAAHPRLDLFVDSNSPHPLEKFGCSSCHGGQGSATDFTLAAHAPNGVHQQEDWEKRYHWEGSEFWDFPMNPARFAESGCVKCHRQLTDLIRHGNKEEAPKLLRGYNLVRENGCFGCHEINALKGGKEVGPDLRLEPSPALEYLSAADQDKARSDPLNPPGTYRKVGPGLRRLAEKTNEAWVRQWILSPRGFRPDTKMPHFYGLSNNDAEALKNTANFGVDQRAFPDAEIHSIAHYLLAESKGHLQGTDSARKDLQERLKTLQTKLKNGPLSDREKKDIEESTRRLMDLALLSVPMQAREITALADKQQSAQDKLLELRLRQKFLDDKQAKNQELSDDEQKDLKRVQAERPKYEAEMDQATAALEKAGKPTPIKHRLIGEDGATVAMPPAPKDDAERKARALHGRQLFTEKGCLACHAHQGTEKPDGGLPAVHGEQNFGPELSRVAAKIGPDGGDAEAKRRWVVQWVLNPTIHYPRTRMPITHLTPDDASDVAEWLLSQPAEGWKPPEMTALTEETLRDLAKVYLAKAPGLTKEDAEKYLGPNGKGVPKDYLENVSWDADERHLAEGQVSTESLKWYVGKKSISRMGCFGCHDVPGFELAKPIGTGLNDWGRKDPERLAFEDVTAYLHGHYNIVPSRDDETDKSKPAEGWQAKDLKPPYEKFFAEALEHHNRIGFLHQKLEEPRSFDYNRDRSWDDRLRMPQFRFARSRQQKDESNEAYEIRQSKDEAEAREAVMTFILGLTSDPLTAKYVYNPGPDRLAEIKGRQVIDKFNCAGCHQVQPGIYEIKRTDEVMARLDKAFDKARRAYEISPDNFFADHNAWAGVPQNLADRLMIRGTPGSVDEEQDDNGNLKARLQRIRLSDAVRYANNDRAIRDVPAGNTVEFSLGPNSEFLSKSNPLGGYLAELLVPYLTSRDPRLGRKIEKVDDARYALPPPLVREGEKVQSKWLYNFLLNPQPIRPQTYLVLRMPKFSLSPEDTAALVNYFGAIDKRNNPAAGLTFPFATIDQHDERYWRERNHDYVERLGAKGLEERIKRDNLNEAWAAETQKMLKDAESVLAQAKKEADDAKDDEVKKKTVAEWEAKVKELKERVDKKDFRVLREKWQNEEVYGADAYRLLANNKTCLNCHDVGRIKIAAPQGPPLDLASERLRPGWTLRWINKPSRMITYETGMTQVFPNKPEGLEYQDVFQGPSLEQIRAVRDALMDLPRLADLPANRSYVPAPATGGSK
jgi:mono/diheme cytochrome c family protein